jgi:dihydroorotase
VALLLKEARLIDPSVGLDEVADVVVRDGRIAEIGHGLSIPKGIQRDLRGMVLVPGLVDLHAHLRDPGQEYKEDVASGARAAAAGGFTDVLCMPNTRPATDSGPKVAYILDKAKACARTRIHVAGALTAGLLGEALSEMGDMCQAGAVAFTDDGRGVQSAAVMRRAMDYARGLGAPVLSHCQLEDLSAGGMINEGKASTLLGLGGWPAAAEEMQIARDIALCELTGCALHIQHITTRRGVQLVREAKDRGLPVSCEVTPHHLFLSEDDLSCTYDTNLKVNPPLRTRADALALQEALAAGHIDCIATDHAPHAEHEKGCEFELAAWGTTGLETALGLVLTELVGKGAMSLADMVERMAHAPRRIIGLEPVRLEAGSVADLTVIDLEQEWTVGEGGFESRSRNSAFTGRKLKGRAAAVYVAGYASYEDGKAVAL